MESAHRLVVFVDVALMLLLLNAGSWSDGVLVGPPPDPRPPSKGPPAVKVGFYNAKCPRAEEIVRAQVEKRFRIDHTITPALLRMLFHDSFVRGADASILLDSKPGNEAEKDALPNLTIRSFDLIQEVKEALESACPGIVSCADIIVLAVRDSVALAGGPKYDVPTGRLDGKVSSKDESLSLPSPAFPVEQSLESFRQKGLDLEDMVVLLGAHTVGVALCGFFNDRLFNFHGTGAADPTMNPQLVARLSNVCPNPFFTESNADPPINLDQSTPAIFDTSYYSQILAGNGILLIDQEITADPTTIGLVHRFTSPAEFFPAFVRSIIKMGNIGVLTGTDPLGEVRLRCNETNRRSSLPSGPSQPVHRPAKPPARRAAPPSRPGTVPVPRPPVGRSMKHPPLSVLRPPPPVSRTPPKAPIHKGKPSPAPGHIRRRPSPPSSG
ncbi:hypothetical protein KP509_24G072100 [Ceratopteris richardii]|uniref:peroxidase n=1 Tax=Ceratopteris richardii TaxID=49495 RepID=A0A8T2RXN8_CERRI|nr:hypothetical protein KP509_24G072100 [Ceratopteris richardii]